MFNFELGENYFVIKKSSFNRIISLVFLQKKKSQLNNENAEKFTINIFFPYVGFPFLLSNHFLIFYSLCQNNVAFLCSFLSVGLFPGIFLNKFTILIDKFSNIFNQFPFCVIVVLFTAIGVFSFHSIMLCSIEFQSILVSFYLSSNQFSFSFKSLTISHHTIHFFDLSPQEDIFLFLAKNFFLFFLKKKRKIFEKKKNFQKEEKFPKKKKTFIKCRKIGRSERKSQKRKLFSSAKYFQYFRYISVTEFSTKFPFFH